MNKLTPQQLSGEIMLSTLNELRIFASDPQYLQEIIDEMQSLLALKGSDYSDTFKAENHQWENFELAASIADEPIENAFAYQIAHKAARLIKQTKSRYRMTENGLEKVPVNFEGVDDSWIDFVNYTVLLIAYFRYQREAQNEVRTDSSDTTS